MNNCNAKVDALAIKSNDRIRVSAALFHLSLEHYGSIHFLTVNERSGSAFALLRPQFEAHVRGLWYQRCASNHQLALFINDKEPPGITKLISDIEKNPEFNQGALKSLKDDIWKILCGFTHGGYIQASWRITPDEIKVNFNEQHLVSLITTSCVLSLQTYVAMARVAKSDELAIFLKETYQGIFNNR